MPASRLIIPVTGWCSAGLRSELSAADPDFVHPTLRRRLGPLARVALDIGHRCAPPGAPVRIIFASRHGELTRNARMLAELAQQEAPSPANFSVSVLNAIPGIFGIARSDGAASSAISAGPETLPMALLEAAAQAWAAPDATHLLIYADEPPPPLYAELVSDPPVRFALALRIRAVESTRHLVCEWSDHAEVTPASLFAAAQAVLDCLEFGTTSSWDGCGRVWRYSVGAAT